MFSPEQNPILTVETLHALKEVMMRLLNPLSALITLLVLGILNAPQVFADVVRTGPNGNSATTTRSAENGTFTRTTTGPEGDSASTTRTVEDDAYVKTYSGPRGGSVTTTTTAEEGQVNRVTTVEEPEQSE